MAKREYTGSPLDFTMKSIGDNDGTTEGGTTKDDNYEQNTEILPDYVDPEKLTENHWKVVNWFLASADNENPDYAEIADDVDVGADTVEKYIHKFFPSTREITDLSAGRQLSIAVFAYHGIDSNLVELSDEYPISKKTLSYVRNVYPDLIEKHDDRFDKDMLDEAVNMYKQTRSYKAARNRNNFESGNGGTEKPDSGRVKELYEDGLSVAQISEKLDSSEKTVRGMIGGMKTNGYFDDSTDNEGPSLSEDVPSGVLTVTDKKVWKKLKECDDSATVADELNISVTSVEKVRQLASAFYEPGEVNFSIPEQPGWGSNSQLQRVIEHPQSRDVEIESSVDTNSEPEKTESSEGGVSEKTLEILGRYYDLDQDIDQISDEMGISNPTVEGSLAAKRYTDRSDWIVPESDSLGSDSSYLDNAETNGEISDQEGTRNSITSVSLNDVKDYVESLDRNTSEYIRKLIRFEKNGRIDISGTPSDSVVDLSACSCEVPKVKTESAKAGKTVVQSIMCEKCGEQFKSLINEE